MADIELIHNREPNRNHVAALTRLLEQCQEEVCCSMPFVSVEGGRLLLDALDRRAYKNSRPRIKVLLADEPACYLSGHLDLDALQAVCRTFPTEYHAYGDGLHAKVLIADRRAALVTSANLTGGGMRNNFELGLLIRERSLVQEICNEFDRAWKDAQELTVTDIAERSAWAKQNPSPTQAVDFPFRKKIRWRPLTTVGSRTAAGTDYFGGFEGADFERLDPRTYGGSFDDDPVKADVVEKIRQAIAGDEKQRLVRFYLAIKDYLPDPAHLTSHYASRLRVKNFYPSATWLALGRKPDSYVTLAQLAVGVSVERETAGVFVSFNLGEEYELNDDKPQFLKWVKSNAAEFLSLLAQLDPAYELRYSDGNNEVALSVRTVTQSDLDRLVQIPTDHLIDFHISRFYSWNQERSLLQHPSIVLEVADQFKILHPIYLRAAGR